MSMLKSSAGFTQLKDAGGGGGGADPLTFFDVYRDFTYQGDFTTSSAASKTWFNSAPNQIVANQGSANGEEIFSNDTTQHASSIGWEVVTDGIQILGSEIAIKVRMYDGSTEDGLNHDGAAGDDFVMAYVEYHQGGMSNDRRKKFNGPGDKIQTNNPKNWKHNDDYSTDSVTYTAASDDSVELPYGFDPTNGTYMMFVKMRDMTNQRYYQWVIELVSGNTAASDMTTNDTVTQSTADGEAWYLVSNNVKDDGSDELEHFFQENTTLSYYGYKLMTPAAGNFSTVDTFVRAWADDLIAALP